MNITEIVEAWLKEHGYDGLAGDECGCELDDLFPCGEPHPHECVAGHKVPCKPDESCHWCEPIPGNWCIRPGDIQD